MVRKSVSCHSDCVMQKTQTLQGEGKKRSGGSTGYQKCDSSDILLLEDNSTLPSVGRISAFSMMYDRWLWLFFFFFLVAII